MHADATMSFVIYEAHASADSEQGEKEIGVKAKMLGPFQAKQRRHQSLRILRD